MDSTRSSFVTNDKLTDSFFVNNGDGKLDVVVSALSAPTEIWINQSPNQNHWLEFKL